jgi:hypothetical protein
VRQALSGICQDLVCYLRFEPIDDELGVLKGLEQPDGKRVRPIGTFRKDIDAMPPVLGDVIDNLLLTCVLPDGAYLWHLTFAFCRAARSA